MQFTYSSWLKLDLPTRIKIAALLKVPKTGSTHVADNRVVSDGYDIYAIESALTSDGRTIEELVDAVNGVVKETPEPSVVEVKAEEIPATTIEQAVDAPKKRGRPAKTV